MSSLGVRAVVFCFPVILGLLPVAAQSSSYHLEFEDNAGSKQVILVNDSEKPIEAFVASQRCQKATGGNGSVRDILFYPSKDIDDMQAADRSGPPRSGVVDTGARWSTFLVMLPERGDCQNRITAVFFSDGSFEGDDAAVRNLKAGRDGLAAGVHYWAHRISREKPDGSTLNSLLAEVRERAVADEAKQLKYFRTGSHGDSSAQPLREYWASWVMVERDIELRFPKDIAHEEPSATLRRLADMINGWKAKIDGDIALQKLNMVFPAISESSASKDR